MKVFLTGATGVLGRSVVPRLVGAGHDVTAVARDDAKASTLRDAGAQPVAVDLFDADAVLDGTRDHAAILHLATNVPPTSRAARKSAWVLHNRLRTEATRHLVAAGRMNGVTRFVKESVTFTYPDCGDRWIDEDVAPDPSFTLLAPTLEGERRALELADGVQSPAAVVLRFGLFYGGAGNRATDEWLRTAWFGRVPVAGARDAFLSPIHVDDAAAAVVHALDVPTGVYNVVDAEPLSRGEHVEAFRAAFGLRRAKPTPGWPIRLVGGPSANALLASQRVANGRFRAASGWEPRYPSAREGWQHVAAGRSEEETHV
ncbi:MAG TPA: NAD(P)-dependent oxidoreductase [Acidimicrobiia bacterium]|nr:NAD(P)-dependent oxidoreductase [Acidimicrobiia bacterium]